ncbi:hypothetical protein CEXT_521701 [Caerostris extrusa]|uniref:Uncharacterized protein n=1 Tax=Caerostris extrusa TaxID=172846 RepID=A0AAV4SRB2_CAEEX|nr:hypothetical protein CEXT_521701 [Caerostris extrusa]
MCGGRLIESCSNNGAIKGPDDGPFESPVYPRDTRMGPFSMFVSYSSRSATMGDNLDEENSDYKNFIGGTILLE